MVFALVAGCTQAATLRATPSAKRSPAPSRSEHASLTLADAVLTASDNEALFVFQVVGDGRLRGLSWDGSANGLLTREGPFGLSSQSPDGRFVIQNRSIDDRHGHRVGPFPWPGKDFSPRWSPDSAVMCRAFSPSEITGSALQLDLAVPGRSPRTVARGFATFFDQSSYPVLACDPSAGRAIVAQYDATGSAALNVWVMRLTDGAVLRSINAPGGWVAASGDGALVARTIASGSSRVLRTVVERSDDGSMLSSVDGLDVRGFSGDGTLLVGMSGSAHTPVLINWRSGRRVWSAGSGTYCGYLTEPAGGRLVIGLASAADQCPADAYLVAPEGAAIRLPERITAALTG